LQTDRWVGWGNPERKSRPIKQNREGESQAVQPVERTPLPHPSIEESQGNFSPKDEQGARRRGNYFLLKKASAEWRPVPFFPPIAGY
jgi:hypothetical protein